uniref:Uncharacterized protein n=1 Tax=Setaria italica TaxID=4555 RepID=K3ZXC2_SETIT
MARAGVFSPVPGMGGRAAAARVPAAGLAVRGCAASKRSTPPHSAAVFPAFLAVRRRARVVSKAGEGSPEQTAAQEPPPPKGSIRKFLLWVFKRIKEKLLNKTGVTLILLLISLALALLTSRNVQPYSGHATCVINICDKAEKVFKFASHFVPIAIALWEWFWDWYVNTSYLVSAFFIK